VNVGCAMCELSGTASALGVRADLGPGMCHATQFVGSPALSRACLAGAASQEVPRCYGNMACIVQLGPALVWMTSSDQPGSCWRCSSCERGRFCPAWPPVPAPAGHSLLLTPCLCIHVHPAPKLDNIHGSALWLEPAARVALVAGETLLAFSARHSMQRCQPSSDVKDIIGVCRVKDVNTACRRAGASCAGAR
jgi:hypothetical protein